MNFPFPAREEKNVYRVLFSLDVSMEKNVTAMFFSFREQQGKKRLSAFFSEGNELIYIIYIYQFPSIFPDGQEG